MHKVLDLGTMDDHSRVRFSLSFYSCVPDGNIHSNYQSITDSEPALDFDAILVDAAEQEVLDVSNSFLDTNEGFDHYLKGGGEDVEVCVVFPPDSEDPTCYPNAPDSYSWAAVWW